MAKLDQVNIVVRNMDAMAEFYRRLGVDVQSAAPEWAPHHRNNASSDGIDLDLDSQQFAAVWNQGWPGGPGIVLGFRLPDRESVDRLESGPSVTSVGQEIAGRTKVWLWHGPMGVQRVPSPGPSYVCGTSTAGAQVPLTNSAGDAVELELELRQRAHADVENRIKAAKDTGLERMPFASFSANVGVDGAGAGGMRPAGLAEGARPRRRPGRVEPKALRYRLLHVGARIVRLGRGRAAPCPKLAVDP